MAADPPSGPRRGVDRGAIGNLRSRAARGTVLNGAFLVATNALTLAQGVIVARLLPTSTYGRWGLLMAAFMTLITLGSVGIDDKYIQQDDPDQERAFQIAFTLQAVLGVAFVVIILLGVPAFALVYGRPEIIAPGAALALAIPALVLQMPLWVHYRRMNFARQRALQLVDPVVTLVTTVGLVVAGLGLWALVIGAMSGSWIAALVMIRTSPYRLRFRWDRRALHEYRRFSWPLFVGALSSMALVQAPIIVGSRELGVEAVAAIALAGNVSQFSNRVDTVITQTLYPAICAVKDRADLLFESFWKSNRLALLWAAPLGIAAALFAGDFVHLVIGEKWRFAVPLIALFGVNAVIDQVGFNWTAFFRARDETRPIAVASVIVLVVMMALAVPLLATRGITAYGAGVTVATVVGTAVRLWFLRRIFPSLAVVRHMARGIGPSVPAAAVVLLLRVLEPAPRTATRVAAEAILFAAMVVEATYLSERPLLHEAVGYVRRSGRLATASAG